MSWRQEDLSKFYILTHSILEVTVSKTVRSQSSRITSQKFGNASPVTVFLRLISCGRMEITEFHNFISVE